ncbi:DUF2062 domain-containing protein [candidate division KSB1 bacterium]|nr:TIGR03546 family protein [bacterium]OQX58359.1 MAG: hypothetical protein B5M50_04470 [candidate division KSB1 bacterium 4484_219]RKY78019.1 MAG: DUF2062 domain-containing protein [candidate division KSB1 bacterium]RKY84957.1 MAG: DUF2062 domain-containing protein [candidate division KSB1 bacterium]HDI52057.1 TIGR03546 family protein [Bacteroidota bacterium]
MFALKLLSKFIKVLRSAASPNQIAWGFALGAILGLTPLWRLHNLVVLVLLIVLNINVTSAMLAFALFSFFAWLLDPLFHSIGYFVLVKLTFLTPLWTSLYNAPIAPFTRFNNTITMGSLLLSLVLLVPNYLLFKRFVIRYRDSWNKKIQKWKITKILQGSKLVKFYLKIRNLGD